MQQRPADPGRTCPSGRVRTGLRARRSGSGKPRMAGAARRAGSSSRAGTPTRPSDHRRETGAHPNASSGCGSWGMYRGARPDRRVRPGSPVSSEGAGRKPGSRAGLARRYEHRNACRTPSLRSPAHRSIYRFTDACSPLRTPGAARFMADLLLFRLACSPRLHGRANARAAERSTHQPSRPANSAVVLCRHSTSHLRRREVRLRTTSAW